VSTPLVAVLLRTAVPPTLSATAAAAEASEESAYLTVVEVSVPVPALPVLWTVYPSVFS
jgi:hypothetical protein